MLSYLSLSPKLLALKSQENYNVIGHKEAANQSNFQPLSPTQKQSWFDPKSRPGIIVDVRSASNFRENHLSQSIALPNDLLSAYGGWILPYGSQLLIVAENTNQAQQAYMQLIRMGYFTCVGYITDLPVREEKDDLRIDNITTITADDVEKRLKASAEPWVLLDVRKADEVESNPFPGATHCYLGYLTDSSKNVDPDISYTCMCGSDKRATVAASLLIRRGVSKVDVFEGSLKAWKSYKN